EVTLREYRAGYRGFSFPIGKTGIRYRVGGAKGHSVVTGAQMQVADSGTLSISSQRAVLHWCPQDDRDALREARQSLGVLRRRPVPSVEPADGAALSAR